LREIHEVDLDRKDPKAKRGWTTERERQRWKSRKETLVRKEESPSRGNEMQPKGNKAKL
jgi:aminoglycoside phosphotransferase (APT) family kinase protein